MSKIHAVLSPSSASRWTSCTASPMAAAENNTPDEGSEAARLGTCGHQILEDLLRDPSLDPQSFLGREFLFFKSDDGYGDGWASATHLVHIEILNTITVDQDLIDAVVTARNFVVEQAKMLGGEIHAEQRVPIGHITGEEDAHGTSDVVIVAGDLVVVMDLKLGRRRVNAYDVIEPAHEDIITGNLVPEVTRPNLQLSMYALGVIEQMRQSFERVRLVILQPFLSHVSEWSGTLDELLSVGDWLSEKAEETRSNPKYHPSFENCLYCRASGACGAQSEAAISVALTGFEDVETAKPRAVDDLRLGDLYALTPMVRKWADAVEQRVRDQLNAGIPVTRTDGISYHFVDGGMGARQWVDEAEAEETLKKMRLRSDDLYTRKLISPTQAEKLAKPKKVKKGEEPPPPPPVLGKRQWDRLQSLIRQERKAPIIALSTDPRTPIAQASGFEDVPTADDISRPGSPAADGISRAGSPAADDISDLF